MNFIPKALGVQQATLLVFQSVDVTIGAIDKAVAFVRHNKIKGKHI